MVYVDDMRAKYRGMIMCHMMADTRAELIAMADRIGVRRKWIQKEDTYLEHFDISLAKRKLAVKYGAKEIEYGVELAKLLEKRKHDGWLQGYRQKKLDAADGVRA